jgi:hypothetical protein
MVRTEAIVVVSNRNIRILQNHLPNIHGYVPLNSSVNSTGKPISKDNTSDTAKLNK